MKKFLFLIVALFALSLSNAFAEQSSMSMDGISYRDQQVWVNAYNNSGSSMGTGSIVILDTTATGGTTLGAYITTVASANSPYVFGVTDNDNAIAAGSVGRVCIRGPITVKCITTTPTIGQNVGTSTTAGSAIAQTGTSTTNGVLGTCLRSAPATGGPSGTSPGWYWVWVRPSTQ